MKKVAAAQCDFAQLEVSGSGRNIAQKEVLSNLKIAPGVQTTNPESVKERIQKVSKNELVISGPGLELYFIGEANQLSQKLKSIIKIDPKKSSYTEMSIIIGSEEFNIKKRMNVPHTVWTISMNDVERLGAAMGWQRKDAIPQLSKNFMSICILSI